ncbi:hypothetical protein RND71_027206 [Anisodus tanguticus]|uniref:Uncharacterized protein n=1 Tax=Anisodus tanguticus TaxID=243964 RepID=A0AAE1V4I1_9SOLA|nr:hypothetical protein RND71_027206 [Anisodus tanguticus]
MNHKAWAPKKLPLRLLRISRVLSSELSALLELTRIVTIIRICHLKLPENFDVINARLLSLDMKVDSKPGYPQTLAIGLASGSLLQVLPRVAESVGQIWNTVRSATNSKQS